MTSSTPPSPPAPAPVPDTPSVAGEEDPGAALDDGRENGVDSEPDRDQGASGASCKPRSEPQRRA